MSYLRQERVTVHQHVQSSGEEKRNYIHRSNEYSRNNALWQNSRVYEMETQMAKKKHKHNRTWQRGTFIHLLVNTAMAGRVLAQYMNSKDTSLFSLVYAANSIFF